jgi:hypothetical protein
MPGGGLGEEERRWKRRGMLLPQGARTLDNSGCNQSDPRLTCGVSVLASAV